MFDIYIFIQRSTAQWLSRSTYILEKEEGEAIELPKPITEDLDTGQPASFSICDLQVQYRPN